MDDRSSRRVVADALGKHALAPGLLSSQNSQGTPWNVENGCQEFEKAGVGGSVNRRCREPHRDRSLSVKFDAIRRRARRNGQADDATLGMPDDPCDRMFSGFHLATSIREDTSVSGRSHGSAIGILPS